MQDVITSDTIILICNASIFIFRIYKLLFIKKTKTFVVICPPSCSYLPKIVSCATCCSG